MYLCIHLSTAYVSRRTFIGVSSLPTCRLPGLNSDHWARWKASLLDESSLQLCFWCFVCLVLIFFFETESFLVYSSGCFRTYYVDQAAHELTKFSQPISQDLRYVLPQLVVSSCATGMIRIILLCWLYITNDFPRCWLAILFSLTVSSEEIAVVCFN